MKPFLSLLAGLSLCVGLSAEETTNGRVNQETFARQQLDKVMQLYRQGKREDALKQLDISFKQMNAEYGGSWALYDITWTEAQIHSGCQDEEWGLEVFLYLLRKQGGESSLTAAPARRIDYLLHGNVMEKLHSLGRVNVARELALREQASLAAYDHLDAANLPYKDLGPLYGFLPQARNREFPIHKQGATNFNSPDSLFVYYPQMYAVQDIANAALDVGDWVRAAELLRWYVDYTAAYCKTTKIRAEEVSRNAVDAYGCLASICELNGQYNTAIQMYEEFLTLSKRDEYLVDDASVESARLSQLVTRIQLKSLPPDAVDIAERACKTIADFTYFTRLNKFHARTQVARIYHAKGDRKHAWEIINELSAQADKDVNPHYQIVLLGPKIDFAIEEGGKDPRLEEWLIRLLKYQRSMGNKWLELPLYEQYAQFLKLNKRFAEAVEIQREAVRLSNAMRIPYKMETNQTILNELLELLDEENARQVDLQPLTSRSMVAPGTMAFGRFYLTNPSHSKKDGILKITGPIKSHNKVNPLLLAVGLENNAPLKTLEFPIALDAGTTYVVDATGKDASKDSEKEFTCVWNDRKPNAKSEAPKGIWVYGAADVTSTRSVVDAHTVKISPFYLVPIRHLIQRTEGIGNQENVDFNIRASKPMRIEVYDSTATRLICVDANGDGDFEDEGDLVYQDLNSNGHPDVVMAKDAPLTSLTLYVEPEPLGGEESSISVSMLEHGEWRVDAVDTIR